MRYDGGEESEEGEWTYSVKPWKLFGLVAIAAILGIVAVYVG